MGIIGSMLNSAAREAGKVIALQGVFAAAEAVDNATSSLSEIAAKRRIKRDEKYIAARPDNTFLYLQFVGAGLSTDMRVYDQEGDEPYLITGSAGKRLFSFEVKR